jgi:predicted transposase/invertase (TIGR01784 family)
VFIKKLEKRGFSKSLIIMEKKAPRFMNPYTDFGFKKLFGIEPNKDLLIDFLNQLLPPEHEIMDLSFKNPEHFPDLPFLRKAIFDIYCTGKNGQNFIVEMQKEKLQYFKDRGIFYLTFPIQAEAKKGEWDFRLPHIYFIAILDFKYDEKEEKKKFERYVQLKDQDGEVFYNKLHLKFLQMPLFTKKESELTTRYDKWCYFLKNLETLDDIPQVLNEPIFEKAFKTAEISAMSKEEHDKYLESLMSYWESKGMLETARAEGEAKGRIEGKIEGKIEVIQNAIQEGLSDQMIVKLTGLSLEEIQKIRKVF